MNKSLSWNEAIEQDIEKSRFKVGDKVFSAFDEPCTVNYVSDDGKFIGMTLDRDQSYEIASCSNILLPRHQS